MHPRPFRHAVAPLALLAALALGAAPLECAERPRWAVEETWVSLAGHPEPHTPGSGAPEELPAGETLRALLGPAPELNRVDFLRFRAAPPPRRHADSDSDPDSDSGPAVGGHGAAGGPNGHEAVARRAARAKHADSDSDSDSGARLDRRGPRPRAVVILMPGFLGGAASFRPLAQQLVRASHGRMEVWAIDRRPNQLEDRLGTRHAARGTPEAIAEGFQFYFPDEDLSPPGNFPGPEDVDIDADGVLDPPVLLRDERGTLRGFAELGQDDVRFAAFWGIDTLARDWMRLVREARRLVGRRGLVIVGGHSLGTTLTGIFAAYDLDPGPGVDAVHQHVDGLLLLEGGGPGPGSATVGLSDGDVPRPATAAGYRALVERLATPGGPDVFLESVLGIAPRDLGAAAELSAHAAAALPGEPAMAQRTPLFRGFPLSIFFSASATNRAAVGVFVDDDFQPFTAFRASVGFSDDGPNQQVGPVAGLIPDAIYVAQPRADGMPRTWKEFDDPTLPTCPPNEPAVSPGCAILDLGPRPAPDAPPAGWGMEREVTDLDDILAAQTARANFIEWYFLAGRLTLDLAYGRDASVLGDDALLAVTQNARVAAPVLAIGGSNGLTPTEASFAGYLGSIATPPDRQEIVILEGYAHLDVTTATDNEAVPVITAWVDRLLHRRRGRP